ncbi:MAG: hypothetical protein N3D84_01195 [Candidatus Woesearchaeota archaeon]|nr:hypothetical protein [Candidatus Woesearchaeota archaeon]
MKDIKKQGKKSQIQMMETVMVLFVFFVIVGLAFIFYSRIQTGKINEMNRQKAENEAVAIAQNVIYMPELQCSESDVQTDLCYDIYKLEAFSSMVKPNKADIFLFYRKDLGESVVNVEKIFPQSGKKWEVYNNTPLEMEKRGYITTEIPILLKDPTKRTAQYSIGLLSIKVYI